jgi:hypothetical protein
MMPLTETDRERRKTQTAGAGGEMGTGAKADADRDRRAAAQRSDAVSAARPIQPSINPVHCSVINSILKALPDVREVAQVFKDA